MKQNICIPKFYLSHHGTSLHQFNSSALQIKSLCFRGASTSPSPSQPTHVCFSYFLLIGNWFDSATGWMLFTLKRWVWTTNEINWWVFEGLSKTLYGNTLGIIQKCSSIFPFYILLLTLYCKYYDNNVNDKTLCLHKGKALKDSCIYGAVVKTDSLHSNHSNKSHNIICYQLFGEI